jgi:CelD/BcsL family acetyltransferase involved in cellulose biosynthesis
MASVPLLDATTPELSLEEVDSPDSIADEWAELAKRSRNVFGTWDWLSLWWEHYGGNRRLRITACRGTDGELVALLPLYMYSQRRLRIARFLGHGPGDELGPVCAPADRPLVARALSRLAREWGLHVLVAEHLPGDEAWRRGLGGSEIGREASPALLIETSSWEDFLAAKSRNFRQQSAKLERRLRRSYRFNVRVADDPDRLERDLDLLFELHGARWRDDESEFIRVDQSFQRAFAVRAFERGWLRLRFLELDDRAVAASYLLRFGDVDAEYQRGRDPAFAKERVGLVIVGQAIRSAIEDGQSEYRFLRGGEEYKYRYATHDQQVESIALATGCSGRVALSLGLGVRRRPTLWSGVMRVKSVFRR